jgi:hypothetical protein
VKPLRGFRSSPRVDGEENAWTGVLVALEVEFRRIKVTENEKNAKEEVLPSDNASVLELRELDVSALEEQAVAVWETVESMQEAQTVSKDTLTCEISV